MTTATATNLDNIDRLILNADRINLAVCIELAQGNGGDFGFIDELAAAWAMTDTCAIAELARLDAFITVHAPEIINGERVQQYTAAGNDHFGDPAWVAWAHATLNDEPTDDADEPEAGTPAAAVDELQRRAYNRAAKRDGMPRLEAATEWAFTASGPELKALAAQA